MAKQTMLNSTAQKTYARETISTNTAAQMKDDTNSNRTNNRDMSHFFSGFSVLVFALITREATNPCFDLSLFLSHFTLHTLHLCSFASACFQVAIQMSYKCKFVVTHRASVLLLAMSLFMVEKAPPTVCAKITRATRKPSFALPNAFFFLGQYEQDFPIGFCLFVFHLVVFYLRVVEQMGMPNDFTSVCEIHIVLKSENQKKT